MELSGEYLSLVQGDNNMSAKDAVATMGTILSDPEVKGRDAVHVAVIAVVAGEKLSPGQDVELADGRAPNGEYVAVTKASKKYKLIGIVDPYLKAVVWPDERFWLYLYPRTITGLNHHWTHPDFPEEDTEGQAYARPAEQLASEQWIREYCNSMGVDYVDMMAHADTALHNDSHYWVEGGRFEGEYLPDEFWTHYEHVTGKTVPNEKRRSFFSCSC